jgi:hypothetical protein
MVSVGLLALPALAAQQTTSDADERATDFSSQQQQQQQIQRFPQGGPRNTPPRAIAPTVAPQRPMHPRGVPQASPRVVAPAVGPPRYVNPSFRQNSGIAPTDPSGTGVAAPSVGVSAERLRGIPNAGSTYVHGQNFSAWRGGYRVHYGTGWRTLAALSALGAIAIGGNYFYPYAYISAPQPYCEGFTEDGCQLTWQDVETVEGDIVGQCVAYCPWQ